MDKKLSEMIDEAIKVELNVSTIYEIFSKSFVEDSDFWSQLVIE